MAGSSNTTWSKGFSGNPAREACGESDGYAGRSLAELLREIGGEPVVYPTGGDDALRMTRREALARTLWTRGVIDGDMTAIKLLVELLEGKGVEAGAGADAMLNVDQLAAAEAVLKAWAATQATAEMPATDEAKEVSGDGND